MPQSRRSSSPVIVTMTSVLVAAMPALGFPGGEVPTKVVVGVETSPRQPSGRLIPCGDFDRDGFIDEGCGGDDCDDRDPGIHPRAIDCSVCHGFTRR